MPKRLTQLGIYLALTLLITSCGIIGPSQSGFQSRKTLRHDASYYLQQAQQNTGDKQTHYQLLAATAYIHNQKYQLAKEVLNTVPVAQLQGENLVRYRLLTARLDLDEGNPFTVVQQLRGLPSVDSFAPDLKIEYYHLLAQAYQEQGKLIPSIWQRLLLAPLLQHPEDQRYNQRLIWQSAQHLSDEQLHQLGANSQDVLLQGWAKLALISRRYNNDAAQLFSHLERWRKAYPNHPANALLATDLPSGTKLEGSQQQIALLLPLQGNFSGQANAILNGFMFAYYQQPEHSRPQIKVYDTSQNIGVDALYDQAVQEGAGFVVGPLLKQRVTTLVQRGNFSVPTLALNYTEANEQNEPSTNLYEFGLSPDHEAAQVANRIWQDGHDTVIIFGDSSARGKDTTQDFTREFERLGGQVIDSVDLVATHSSGINVVVARALHIDESETRIQAIQKIAGEKVMSTARRRQDIDAFFINVSTQQARQLIPALRFYYAYNIPVYSTSRIYNGTPALRQNRDLNGVRFPVMPWIIAPSSKEKQMQQELARDWSSSFHRYRKLYAIGIDSYTLLGQLGNLRLLPGRSIDGHTGQLYLESNHHIYRYLPWAQFKKGTAHAIARKSSHPIAPFANLP